MDKVRLLMEALRAAVRGRAVDWSGRCGEDTWKELLELARSHKIVPLVLEAVCACADFRCAPEAVSACWKREAAAVYGQQIRRDEAFRKIYSAMTAAGLQPLVMKGAVCRSLYPDPARRPSADEDLLLRSCHFEEACRLLQALGMEPAQPNADPACDVEISMASPNGLYLELHRLPFPGGGSWETVCNVLLNTVQERAVTADGLLTMAPHDHMLYLLLHACKHLIHSGFGLRQACDIALWAERHGEDIQWPLLWQQLRQARCLKFAQTVFALATQYLDFDGEKAGVGALPRQLPVQQLLEDMLDAGIYGNRSGERVHSATITRNAVEAAHSGKKTSLLRTVFPKREDLTDRYPCLRRYPALLPAAWGDRLLRYAAATIRQKKLRAPAESIAFGEKRKQLLRELDILDNEISGR